MRKTISIVVAVALALSLAACARPMNICGVTYGSYGLLNENDSRNSDIQYDVVWGNVFWGIVFVETIIAPLYFFGFSLFEPVGTKPAVKGQIDGRQQCKQSL